MRIIATLPEKLEKKVRTIIKRENKTISSYVTELIERDLKKEKRFEIKGIRGKDFLRLVAMTNFKNLNQIENAIQEDCEKIDTNEW